MFSPIHRLVPLLVATGSNPSTDSPGTPLQDRTQRRVHQHGGWARCCRLRMAPRVTGALMPKPLSLGPSLLGPLSTFDSFSGTVGWAWSFCSSMAPTARENHLFIRIFRPPIEPWASAGQSLVSTAWLGPAVVVEPVICACHALLSTRSAAHHVCTGSAALIFSENGMKYLIAGPDIG